MIRYFLLEKVEILSKLLTSLWKANETNIDNQFPMVETKDNKKEKLEW